MNDEEAKRRAHDFLQSAAPQLRQKVESEDPIWIERSYWRREADGNVRQRRGRTALKVGEWLASLSGYNETFEAFESNPTIKRHLATMVGAVEMGSASLDAPAMLVYLANQSIDFDGEIAFSAERFLHEWERIINFFVSDVVPAKMIAPLKQLSVPFPLLLNDELVLDRFSDDEIDRAYMMGVLRPHLPSFGIMLGAEAVGLRKTSPVRKLVGSDAGVSFAGAQREQNFGRRAFGRSDLAVEDVLLAMRLFKSTRIQAAGAVSWLDTPFSPGTYSQGIGPALAFGSDFILSEEEAPAFVALWEQLSEMLPSHPFLQFSSDRFSLAFERRHETDRIVDLVIAAESLLLSDMDETYRGELRYRFSVRAAKFLKSPKYPERDVFKVMRRAYDARSAIVHGGTPRDTKLPGNDAASLNDLSQAAEELIRVGLKSALDRRAAAVELRQSTYWDSLILQ